MADRTKRFIQSGVLSAALDDQAEQDALVNFFVNTLLPLQVTRSKISDLIIEELIKQKFIGPGNDSFAAQAAINKIAIEGLSEFLAHTFGSEWTGRLGQSSSTNSTNQ